MKTNRPILLLLCMLVSLAPLAAASCSPEGGILFADLPDAGTGGASGGDAGAEAGPRPEGPGDPCDDAGGRYDKGGACCHLDCLSAANGWTCKACADAGTDAAGGDGGYVGSCAHDPCGAGAPLAPSCDPCVADICAMDPKCCAVGSSWVIGCVSEVSTTCGDGGFALCPASSGTCAHHVCEVGAALDASCSLCAYTVCAKHTACCSVMWGQLCVDAVFLDCGLACP